MQQYLDKNLLPKGPTGRMPASLQSARIRKPSEQSTCFLAQYHRQHMLPATHLASKGLLGSLLQAPEGLRFYSGPETASSQGVNGLLLLPHCDATCMKILGNSLATPQAGFVLGLALQLFPDRMLTCTLDAADCVDLCHQATIRASNAILLEVAEGWLLCRNTGLGPVLARRSLHEQIAKHLLPSPHSFRQVIVATGEGSNATRFVLQVSEHVSDEALCQVIPLSPEVVFPASAVHDTCMDLAESPLWPALSSARCKLAATSVLMVWAKGIGYVLRKASHDAFHQLRQVFHETLSGTTDDVAVFDMAGTRLRHFAALPTVALAVPAQHIAAYDCPTMTPQVLTAACLDPKPDSLSFRVNCERAEDWYLSFPVHLLEAVGWSTCFSSLPHSPAESLLISCRPSSDAPFSLASTRLWLRNLFFLAPLRVADQLCQSTSTCTNAIAVEVQIQNTTLWTGSLPAAAAFDDLEQAWRSACKVTVQGPDARVFSGPFPVAPATVLGATRHAHQGPFMHRKATGRLVLTIMPSCTGGGAKEDRLQTLRSRLAQAYLQQGYSLQELNVVVDQMTKQVAHSKLQHALEARPATEQWLQLQSVMQAHGIQEPHQGALVSRVAHKVQAQVKRRQLFQDKLCAESFSLAGGFFTNADGSPATILKQLMPNTSGVILLDHHTAKDVLQDMANQVPDELGLVCLGHECPHPATCSKRLQVCPGVLQSSRVSDPGRDLPGSGRPVAKIFGWHPGPPRPDNQTRPTA